MNGNRVSWSVMAAALTGCVGSVSPANRAERMRRMKNRIRLALCGWALAAGVAFGQGSLTPPGAPVPTMKSLDQIEPRTVITNLPWTISTPGGYVLDRNLSLWSGDGISVTVSDVTLDLNGFVLTGDPRGGGHGIHVAAGAENVTIKNGVLRNWGADGIHAPDAGFVSIRNVQVYGSGGNGVAMNTGELIDAMAKYSGLAGVRTQHDMQKLIIQNVRAIANGGGVVIEGTGEAIIIGSDISSNTGHGIFWVSATADATFRLSLGGTSCNGNTGCGLRIAGTQTARINVEFDGATIRDNGGHGIEVHAPAENVHVYIKGPKGELVNNGGDGIHVGDLGAGARGVLKLGQIGGESLRVGGNGGNGLSVASTAAADVTIQSAGAAFDDNGVDGVRVNLSHADSRLTLEHRGGSAASNVGHGYNVLAAGRQAIQGFFDVFLARNGGSGFREDCASFSEARMDGVSAQGNGGFGLDLVGKRYFVNRSDVVGNASGGIRHQVRSYAGKPYTGLTLNACRVDQNGGHGVEVRDEESSSQVRVCVMPGTSVSGNTGHGVLVHAQNTASALALDWRDAHADGNGSNGVHIEGDAGSGGVELAMEGGSCDNNTGAGLRIINEEGIPPSPRPVKTKGAVFSGNGGHGVHHSGAALGRYSDSRAVRNGGDGIRAERPVAGIYDRWGELIFETNDLVGNNGAGLNIPVVVGSVTGTVVVAGGLVSGNATAGILIADDGVKPGSVNRVSVTGNGGHGIEVAGHDFRIEDNLLARNAGSGIRVTGTGAHVARNQCSGNVTGVELVGLGNAARENIFGGDAAQTPIDAALPGNAVAPIQAIDTGTNPLGNVTF